MTKIICIIGPESTGKSELTTRMAEAYHAPAVPEYARKYFAQKGTDKYELVDIENIGKAQIKLVEIALSAKPKILFCDTDFITLKIWAADKFETEIAFVEENLIAHKADLYLLCRPDLPWQPDPLREDENRRDFLFEWHEKLLKNCNANIKIVSGHGENRVQKAMKFVREFLEYPR